MVPCHACLGQKVIGDLAGDAEDQRRYGGPAGEPAGPMTDDGVAGEPYLQRECAVRFDADGRVTAVSRCRDPQRPGRGRISPNPVICPIPTQPDHTATAAASARTSRGHDRIDLWCADRPGARSAPVSATGLAGPCRSAVRVRTRFLTARPGSGPFSDIIVPISLEGRCRRSRVR